MPESVNAAPAEPAIQVQVTQGHGGDEAVVHAEAAPAGEQQQQPTEQPQGEAPKSLEIAPKGQPERPQWLDPKFKSPEDMAKAYRELEQKQGAKPAGKAPEKGAPAALNFDQYSTEVRATGALSPESRQAIVAAGIPEPMIDAYIAGQQSVSERVTNEAMGVAGGADGYKAMQAWAAENADAATLEQFNRAMGSGNREQILFAVRGLHGMYKAAGAPEPTNAPAQTRLAGGSPSRDLSGVFRSRAEQVAAMRDPRYRMDPAYRDAVMQKTMRSNL